MDAFSSLDVGGFGCFEFAKQKLAYKVLHNKIIILNRQDKSQEQ